MMLRRIGGWLLCLMGDHNWTCKAEEGIDPDPVKLKANPVAYFWEFAQMYCKRCGYAP